MIRELRFNIGGDPKDDTPCIQPDRTTDGSHPAPVAIVLGREDESGFHEGQTPSNRGLAKIPAVNTGGADVVYQHGQKSFRIILPPVDKEFQNEAGEPPQLPPEYEGDADKAALHYVWAVVLPRLVPNGNVLALDNGTPFTAIECSDFNLFNRFLNDEDIEPVLAQRAAVGFNLLRVWSAYNIARIGRLIPREHPDYFVRIPAFLDLCSMHGLYVEFTAFTGPYGESFSNADEMVAFWDAFCAALRQRTNAIVELVNEFDNGPNLGLPYDRLVQPAGLLASHGSGSQDSIPKQPFWGYATYRAAAFEWQRKVGHNADEMGGAFPVLTNETPRYPDNESSLIHAFDGAAGAALLCAGACFHSVNGKCSQLWEGVELEAALAWAQGARSVPLACQNGGYVHRDDLEGSGVIRVYQRGGNPACIVRIRA